MKEYIEELLEQAKSLEKTLEDKVWGVNLGMIYLINELGAEFIKKNVKQCSGSYVTEVRYKGYIFQTVSDRPLRIDPIPYFSRN